MSGFKKKTAKPGEGKEGGARQDEMSSEQFKMCMLALKGVPMPAPPALSEAELLRRTKVAKKYVQFETRVSHSYFGQAQRLIYLRDEAIAALPDELRKEALTQASPSRVGAGAEFPGFTPPPPPCPPPPVPGPRILPTLAQDADGYATYPRLHAQDTGGY